MQSADFLLSESILMSTYVAESINQTTDCSTFRPRRPSSTAYKVIDIFDFLLVMRLYVLSAAAYEKVNKESEVDKTVCTLYPSGR